MRSIVLSIVFASLALAQSEFEVIGDRKTYTVIQSPFELRVAGDYTFFDWEASPGVVLSYATLELTSSVATVTAPVGEHTVTCSAVLLTVTDDGVVKPAIQPFALTFSVGSGTPPGDGTPPPSPTIDVEQLRKISSDGIRKLSDQQMASKLAANISRALGTIKPADDLKLSDAKIATAIDKSFTGSAQWFDEWRKPVWAWMRTNVKTTPDYIASINALVETLRQAGQQALLLKPTKQTLPPKKQGKVWMWTRSDCDPCERWKAEMEPIFRASGLRCNHTFQQPRG